MAPSVGQLVVGSDAARQLAGRSWIPALGRLSFAMQFLLACLGILLAGMLITGAWVGQQIEHGVLSRTAAITALYVESVITPYLQPLATRSRLGPAELAALDRILAETPLGERIVAFKVWSPRGVVLYSSNRRLTGRSFPLERGLVAALNGEVAAQLSDLTELENEYERERWRRLLEVYVPVREHGGERIIAVTEFYQPPDELEREIGAARLRSWFVVAGVTLALYLLLAGIAKRASETITSQQTALRRQVTDLSRLLEQNARLRERVRRAAGRTTALNEQALRRISADLHDGPAQDLALALLRLDAAERHCTGCPRPSDDIPVVHGAVRDALKEVRAIASGLRLPGLAAWSVDEVAEHAVQDHQRRSGTPVQLMIEDIASEAPLPIKIALLRSLQETLSNATRHGGGAGVSVRLWSEEEQLCVTVSDCGPGFVLEEVDLDGHLGLIGMRERAELLGGSFRVESIVGQGTAVHVRWPLAEPEVGHERSHPGSRGG